MSADELGTVLVTGGASGLGAAVVEALSHDGGTPVVLDRARPQDGIDREIVDLAEPRAAEAAVDRIAQRYEHIRAVVTAAGTDACGRLDEVDPESWDRVVRVNLLGNAAVVRAALPHLDPARGRIVIVGSTLGLRALGDATAYCASKFGTIGFARALAAELAGEVGVTLLVPGGMDTSFFDGRPDRYKPGPDAMLNDPRNVASTILFALRQPARCEVRELVVCPAVEPSWP